MNHKLRRRKTKNKSDSPSCEVIGVNGNLEFYLTLIIWYAEQ